ncbi:MAG TPA: LysM peptidoglycan-binding domain-containing protein, partial [Anaerolineae bacterium]|nr:LysM peptidoglycan-binding domain-containing protein [Anaerolineae bacterium]
ISGASASSLQQRGEGYWYTVKRGDSWSVIAARTGISVAALQALNPQAIHPHHWLWVGDKIWIPQTGFWYTVRPGDSWLSVAARTGVSVATLQAANPQAIRAYNWLWRGERLWIPLKGMPAATPTATSTPVATETVTPTATLASATATLTPTIAPPTVTATVTPTATSTISPTSTLSPTATPTVAPTATPSPTAVATVPVAGETPAAPPPAEVAASLGCPKEAREYPDVAAEFLTQTGGDVTALKGYLTDCGAITDMRGGISTADLDADGQDEVVVIVTEPKSAQFVPPGEITILDTREGTYRVALRGRASGEIELLQIGDVNLDGKMDVAWSDTTCGAHTCFGTVYLVSWDGEGYADWIEGNATMAYPNIRFADVDPQGSGMELVMHGGVIASVGAGPQRPWTETWASIGGAPYTIIRTVYDPSDCLYHHLLDANEAFLKGPTDGFDKAAGMYRELIDNTSLKACGFRPNELDELRGFARFRRALALAHTGDTDGAKAALDELKAKQPDNIYVQVAQVWWDAYAPTQDMASACAAVTAFAENHPLTWQILADFGYANPTFSAAEVCPVPK